MKIACLYGYVEIVELLLKDRRVSLSYEKSTAFKYASMAPHLQIIDILIRDERFDIKKENITVGIYIRDILPIILQHPNIDLNDDDLLNSLCYSSCVDILSQVLLDPRCDVMKHPEAIMFLHDEIIYDTLHLLIKDGRITGELLDKIKIN